MLPSMADWARETVQSLDQHGPVRANVCGSTTAFNRIGVVKVLTKKKPKRGVWLPGFVTDDAKQLPRDCMLVVNPEGIYDVLGISLDKTYADRKRERQ